MSRISAFLNNEPGATAIEYDRMAKVFSFLADDSGATAIEYCLLAAGISIVIISSVNVVGTTLNGTFGTVSTQLK
jgi:pilus assembly protein Flp/PilA